jgi:hypothetical protein
MIGATEAEQFFILNLSQNFEMKDLGEASYVIGIEIYDVN